MWMDNVNIISLRSEMFTNRDCPIVYNSSFLITHSLIDNLFKKNKANYFNILVFEYWIFMNTKNMVKYAG